MRIAETPCNAKLSSGIGGLLNYLAINRWALAPVVAVTARNAVRLIKTTARLAVRLCSDFVGGWTAGAC